MLGRALFTGLDTNILALNLTQTDEKTKTKAMALHDLGSHQNALLCCYRIVKSHYPFHKVNKLNKRKYYKARSNGR